MRERRRRRKKRKGREKKTKRKRGKDGNFVRPQGRNPKGKEWDPKAGNWIHTDKGERERKEKQDAAMLELGDPVLIAERERRIRILKEENEARSRRGRGGRRG